MNPSWRAVGEFVLLESHESMSRSGLITETMYTIHSIGKQVPTELEVGDSVVLTEEAILSSLHPEKNDGLYVLHYTKICAVASAFDNDEFAVYVNGEPYHDDLHDDFF